MGFAAGDPYCTVGSSGEVDAGLEAELDAAALGQGGAGRSAWGRLGRTSPPPLELRVVEVPFGGSGPVVCVASAGVRTSQSVVSPLSEASTTLPGDPYRDDGLGGTSDCEDDAPLGAAGLAADVAAGADAGAAAEATAEATAGAAAGAAAEAAAAFFAAGDAARGTRASGARGGGGGERAARRTSPRRRLVAVPIRGRVSARRPPPAPLPGGGVRRPSTCGGPLRVASRPQQPTPPTPS